MEIERKFTLKELPADLESYPCHVIEQAYQRTSPPTLPFWTPGCCGRPAWLSVSARL